MSSEKLMYDFIFWNERLGPEFQSARLENKLHLCISLLIYLSVPLLDYMEFIFTSKILAIRRRTGRFMGFYESASDKERQFAPAVIFQALHKHFPSSLEHVHAMFIPCIKQIIHEESDNIITDKSFSIPVKQLTYSSFDDILSPGRLEHLYRERAPVMWSILETFVTAPNRYRRENKILAGYVSMAEGEEEESQFQPEESDEWELRVEDDPNLDVNDTIIVAPNFTGLQPWDQNPNGFSRNPVFLVFFFYPNPATWASPRMTVTLLNLSKELLLRICEVLAEGESKRDKNKSLLSVALTCRELSGLAISVLWRDLEFINHPTMIVTPIQGVKSRLRKSDKGISYKEWYMDTLLVDTDLQVLRLYANNVRTITIECYDDWVIDESNACAIHYSFFNRITSLLGDRSLFPNLNCLHIINYLDGSQNPSSNGPGALSVYLPFLISPRLKRLTARMELCDNSLDIRAFITDISRKHEGQPKLSQLDFLISEDMIFTPVIPSSIVQSISSLAFLEDVELTKYCISDVTVLQPLTSLEKLKSLRGLRISCNTDITSSQIPRCEEPAAFMHLTSLDFYSICSSNSLMNLFTFFRFPDLQSIAINPDDYHTCGDGGDIDLEKDDIQNILAIFPCFFPKLQSLTLRGDPREMPGLSWEECGAISRLHHLECLNIELSHLSKIYVMEMIRAWPRMRSLSIRSGHLTHDIDHSTLLTITERLPFLVTLVLPLSFAAFPPYLPMVFSGTTRVSQLQELEIHVCRSDSTIKDLFPPYTDIETTHTLAQYLCHTFPDLKQISLGLGKSSVCREEELPFLLMKRLMRLMKPGII
ncbi:hypothetical protein CVT24_003582 [Panaeolus cyanescens]|uniref:F-box domain-containing protein n=1 Tax=Panaeolus cyanescens TaxID=181874 RepID=A0A409Y7A5_9AGAR|nr:hypothetical protein CVT24_003582 [Panaeolus cyanescens]